jgi:hypothetical protein
MERNETFGKCNYINLQNGLKCGCLRYRNINYNNLLCEGCQHDQTFHEKDLSSQSSQNTNYQTINSELNSIFRKRKRPAFNQSIPIQSNEFVDHHSNNNSINLKFNPYHITTSKPINKKPITFSLICLPDGELAPKIPRK